MKKGFKKRKDERRAKANAIKERILKEAKQNVKQAKRDEVKQLLIDYQEQNPEFNELIKPINYELPEHVVTITEMNLNELAGLTNSSLGTNNVEQMNSVHKSNIKSSNKTNQIKNNKIKKINKFKKNKNNKKRKNTK